MASVSTDVMPLDATRGISADGIFVWQNPISMPHDATRPYIGAWHGVASGAEPLGEEVQEPLRPGWLVRRTPGREQWSVYRLAHVERPRAWLFRGGLAAVDYTLGQAYGRARVLGLSLGIFDADT
jgi:hypothetical protein